MEGIGHGRSSARATMVGRDDELLRIAGLARDAAAGRGRLVLIEGEPGIGKTVLLRAALSDAAGLFPRRLAGAAEELDQHWPFATVRACLEPLAASNRRVTDVLASIRGGAAEYPVTEALLALLEEWCAASPVVVAIDDLQWADPASILLLHGLGRVAGQLPLLLAATVRIGAGRQDVDAMVRSWRSYDAEQIALGPLTGPVLHQLVGSLAGGQPGPGLRSLVNGAAGNPSYVTELVTGLASQARLQMRSDAAVDLDPAAQHAAIPPTLRAAVAQRLAFLSAGTRELLQAAALLGTTFSVAELSAVLGRPATELLGHLGEATSGGVLTALPDRLAFRHPLVRAVLDDDLPRSARQALHLQVAQALTARTSPERVAEHLLAAGPAAVSLLPWLGGVADDLAVNAPALAADLLGQVLDTAAGSGGEQVPRLRAALAVALLRSGRPERAEQAARSALVTPIDPRVEAALRWTLANACASQGAMERAVEEVGIALATGRLTMGEQARFYGLSAQCHITLSQPTDATTAWRSSVAAAQASGDIQALAHGMAAAAGARSWDGWIEEALTFADAAITATEALGPRAGAQLAPQIHRGICLTELDRDAEAEQAFEEALKLAEHGVGTDFLPWRCQCVARLRFLQGRWDEALADIQTGLDLPDRLDMGRHLRGMAALIAVHRGDRAALASLLPFLEAPAPPSSPGRQSAATPT